MDTTKRIDIVYWITATEGNPNGDPMRHNRPRIDPHTGEGLISDVCIKRVIRDYAERRGQKLFIARDGVPLSEKIKMARAEAGVVKGKDRKDVDKAANVLAKMFWDVRVFGAVASTGKGDDAGGAGSIRGPVQMTFARSLHPVHFSSHQLTRIASTTERDEGTMTTGEGKHIVRFAVYRGVITYTPSAAAKTGMSEADLDLLLEGLRQGWHHVRSASRGLIEVPLIRVAQHATEDGQVPLSKVIAAASGGDLLLGFAEAPRSWADVKIGDAPSPVPSVVWKQIG